MLETELINVSLQIIQCRNITLFQNSGVVKYIRTYFMEDRKVKITEIFAHRGACGYEPENTMEAFALAVEQGADGIELDVQLTKDGKLVIFHDETIDRMCHGTGWVKDFTLEELRKYEVCSPEGKKGRIPTLREVLELVKPGNLKVNIELKTGIYWYPDIERLTVEEVKRQKMEERVIYSSFNHYSIQKLKEYAPEAETAYLYSDVILNVDEYAKNQEFRRFTRLFIMY